MIPGRLPGKGFMKTVKIISLLLALLITAAAAVSCRDNTRKDAPTGKSSGDTGSGDDGAGYLPDADYGGYRFRILSIANENSGIYTGFDSEADTTDLVLAAQYKRNRKIESRYNIVFSEDDVTGWEELSSTFVNYVSSVSDEYELNMLIQRESFAYGVDGYITRTDKLRYCDTTQPWYVQDVNRALTVNGIQFFSYSSECLNMFAQTNCTVFNKRIAGDNGVEDPYELVKAGTWTLDKMLSSAKAVTRDLNADGVFNDYDQLGIVGESDMIYPSLWIGAGYLTVEKDGDDYPVYTAPSNEGFIDFLTLIGGYFNEDRVIYDTQYRPTEQYFGHGTFRDEATAVFRSGSALYRVAIINELTVLGDMTDDFGIVPNPKLNEEQDGYHSRVIDGWLYVVPNTNTRLDMTSVILEALAIESRNYVFDAYYEQSLKNRYTNDPNAKEMLDLISSTRTIDLGDTVWQADIRNKIQDAVWKKDLAFNSALSSIKSYVDLMIGIYLDELAK